jgi:hypothetical protein
MSIEVAMVHHCSLFCASQHSSALPYKAKPVAIRRRSSQVLMAKQDAKEIGLEQ